jgi:Ca-activated chloride channel family protein
MHQQALVPMCLVFGLASGLARGQTLSDLDSASHVVMPQATGFSLRGDQPRVEIKRVLATVRIADQSATTTLELQLANPGARDAEAILLVPVPDEAVVTAFAFAGAAREPTAKVLSRDEARRLYDGIVARLRDPALLEFAGQNVVRSSLFPVPARGTQRVRLTYEHLLSCEGERADYLLPRSESLAVQVPWQIEVDLTSSSPLASVYSPSHELVTERRGDSHWHLATTAASATNPGPFRLSFLRARTGLAASLFAYPDPKVGGGYFLLMAGLPVARAEHPAAREVTLVLDRSGSMAGAKMEQAKAAARQVIAALEPADSFNILDYATSVSSFAPSPVAKSTATERAALAYLEAVRPGGGTNIHDALLEALRQPRSGDRLPIVLFLTDGLPTVGETGERAIRELVERGNAERRRIFTFGVGADVNAPLLDRIADLTRAKATYVLPGADVELPVAQVFARLAGPRLANLELTALEALGTCRTREVIPSPPPDLFEGDQLIVTGQYLGTSPLWFRVAGDAGGARRTFEFTFDLDRASTRNAFVPRLWASRRIAELVDRVREMGEGTPPAARDARFRELTDEILALSTEFGILSEYTSFLATEGSDLGHWQSLSDACGRELGERAVRARSGLVGVAQACNFNDRKWQAQLNYRNRFWNGDAQLVQSSAVQQVCDRAFFASGERWVEGGLVGKEARVATIVEWGSDAHRRLLDELIAEGRAGVLSLHGEILLDHRGQTILIHNR